MCWPKPKAIAMAARDLLAKDGVRAAVVPMPCWELFEAQSQHYRDQVLGTAPRVAIEAAVSFGWERWIGRHGKFVGMHGFGASAPGEALYPHFGITPERSPRPPARCSDRPRRPLNRRLAPKTQLPCSIAWRFR
jgi:hypothetical protein